MTITASAVRWIGLAILAIGIGCIGLGGPTNKKGYGGEGLAISALALAILLVSRDLGD